MKININQSFTHIVQEVIHDKLLLPNGVNPSSISCVDDMWYLHEFNYVTDEVSVVTKGSVKYSGQLLNQTDNTITILSDGRKIIVRNYDLVAIKNNNYIQLYPYDDTGDKIFCNYLCNDISSEISGKLLVDAHMKKMYLSVSALIRNTSDFTFEGVVSITSGDANVYSSRKLEASAMRTTEHEKVVEDYITFNIGEMTLKDTNIVTLSSELLKYFKIFSVTTSSNNVNFGYRISPNQSIPGCNISVYKTDPDTIFGNYIGSGYLKEVRKGESTDILVGKSNLIKCNNIVTQTAIEHRKKHDDVNPVPIKQEIICEFIARENATVVINHYIGTVDLTKVSIPYKLRKDNYLIWEIDLTKGETTFHCELQYTVLI